MLKPPVCYRILAANRDEFLARPTTPAAFHNFQAPEQSHPHTSEPNEQKYILSGLDLEGGGTWLGVSRPTLSGNNAANQTRLRFATLTNFTENLSTTPRPSRGKLVKDFLDGSHSLDEYLELMERIKADYAGFNLVLGVVDASGQWQMGYVSNRNDENARRIEMPDDGRTLSVSNSTLSGEVWPKCRQGSTNVSRAVREGGDSEEILTDKLWQALSVAQPKPILDRTHLRNTVLVRPTFMDPKAPIPTEPIPFVPAPESTPAPDAAAPIEYDEAQVEGKTGYWYGTRVQSMVLIERERGPEGRVRVKFSERDAYVLSSAGNLPSWSGNVRSFEFTV